MATIILLRHGRTSANASGVLAGWSPDVHLDDRGREQVEAAARVIAAACTPSRIVSSPLVRCLETAEALSRATGVRLEQDEQVGECHYGAWTGRSLSELASEPLWAIVQEAPSQVHFPPSDDFAAEGMVQMQSRAVSAVRAFSQQLDEAAGSGDSSTASAVGVVVSHGDVIKAVLSDALGQALDDFQRIVVSPASMSVVQYTAKRPFVHAMNATPRQLIDVLGGTLGASGDAQVGGSTGATPPAA